MKKYISLLLAGVMALALVACGQQPGAAEVQCYEVGMVHALAEGGVFSEELEELDADIAFALYILADYGLTMKDLTEASVLRSSGATCEEAAVLVFTDIEKAKLAVNALEDYVQNQIDSNVDYRPDEVPKLEDAVVSRAGHTVALIVANDVEKAKDILNIK